LISNKESLLEKRKKTSSKLQEFLLKFAYKGSDNQQSARMKKNGHCHRQPSDHTKIEEK
jgi:hypothetical protein